MRKVKPDELQMAAIVEKVSSRKSATGRWLFRIYFSIHNRGDKEIRIININADKHSVHLPGSSFLTVGSRLGVDLAAKDALLESGNYFDVQPKALQSLVGTINLSRWERVPTNKTDGGMTVLFTVSLDYYGTYGGGLSLLRVGVPAVFYFWHGQRPSAGELLCIDQTNVKSFRMEDASSKWPQLVKERLDEVTSSAYVLSEPVKSVDALQRPPIRHTILFLAANPLGTDHIALDHEARAIQVELERSGFRDRFELVTRWAAEPLDLLRELRKLKPTVVHFSGHGTAGVARQAPRRTPRRDVGIKPGHSGDDPRPGLFFQGPDGGPQLVSTEALEATFGAAGASVQLIVLSACYSELNAQALLRHVGCVVGMSGAIADDAARSFAIGLYGGLGERESIAASYKQGCAAIHLQGLADHDRPKLAVRAGIDAGKLILAADCA